VPELGFEGAKRLSEWMRFVSRGRMERSMPHERQLCLQPHAFLNALHFHLEFMFLFMISC